MKKQLLLLIVCTVANAFSQEKMTVYFDFDKCETNLGSTKGFSEWMSKNRTSEILKIYGYCDSSGSFEYNDELALKRANSVVETLKNNAISFSEKTEIKGFGKRLEQSPLQADNRKVEIYYKVKNENSTTQAKQLKEGDKIRLKNLNFYPNSGKIIPKSEPVLKELLHTMQQNPKLKIEIEGHICCERTDPGISTLRSKTVYEYLIENGIDKGRLSFIGYGSSRPIYPIPEKNEEERIENRRVEVKIIEN